MPYILATNGELLGILKIFTPDQILFNDRYRVLRHIVFWISVLAVLTFVHGNRSGSYFFIFIMIVVTLPVYIGATYFTLYFSVPRFLLQRRYLKFAQAFIYTFLGSIFLLVMLSLLLIFQGMPSWTLHNAGNLEPVDMSISNRALGVFFVLFLATSIKFLKHLYTMEQQNRLLSEEKLKAELSALRSQIHPHFLFNTLNSLYALALQKSDSAPEMILKLSEILDFMLHQSTKSKVPLNDEIDVIRNFIDLELLRHGSRVTVSQSWPTTEISVQIAPLMLLPLVENAFKHGASRIDGPVKIDLSLNLTDERMTFVITNDKPISVDKLSKSKSNGSGIGLANVALQLKLIYPERHHFQFEDLENQFIVKLVIDLEQGLRRKIRE